MPSKYPRPKLEAEEEGEDDDDDGGEEAGEQYSADEEDSSTAVTVYQPTWPTVHIDTIFVIDDHFWATTNALEKTFSTWVLFLR